MFTVLVEEKFESFVYHVQHTEDGGYVFLIWDPFHSCFRDVVCTDTKPVQVAPQTRQTANNISQHQRK